MTRRAWSLLLQLACVGMLGCAGPGHALPSPDDAWIDGVWASVSRGDLQGAGEAASHIADPLFQQRALFDLLAARSGRAAALCECVRQSSWLAARYDASREVALERLRAARRDGAADAVLWLEEARASSTHGRQISAARAALSFRPGGAEALAVQVEALQAGGELSAAEDLLADPELPDTARLRLARRRQELATGRTRSASMGLLQDLHDGLAVPASLGLLADVLRRVPMLEVEEEARQALRAAPIVGSRMQRARDRLLAQLLASAGRLDEATAVLAALDLRLPADDRDLHLLECRLGRAPAGTPEERVDGDPARTEGATLAELRLAAAWDLAARESYADTDDGDSIDLSDFTRRLDAAAAGLPAAPSLSDLPRRDYGIFGAMLDTDPLRDALPGALVLAGKALSLPAELAWFDRQECAETELPGGAGRYDRCTVRRPRVAGYAASHGLAIAGAGIDRVVYIDLDEVELDERESRLLPVAPPLQAFPAHGALERTALREPLDVVDRLMRLARRDAGSRYEELLLEALALHEEQHIRDFRDFVARGMGGKLWSLLSAGLLPASVRAEIERRAQLHALRTASDPRIPLAHAVSYLPAEGAARQGEHAIGYEALVREFIQHLDAGDWPGSQPLAALGLDQQRVLLQQLDRLPPETVRAIALALDD